MIRRKVVVTGRVQGVWFRDSCRTTAQRLGISGWVRNRDDGSVEAVFEGDDDEVATMVEWCHDGPPGAHVVSVDVTDEPAEGERGFEIR